MSAEAGGCGCKISVRESDLENYCGHDEYFDHRACKYPALLERERRLREALERMLAIIRENAFIKTGDLVKAQFQINEAKALLKES